MHVLSEHDWEEQAHVVANVQHAFDASDDTDVTDDEYTAMDVLSPSGFTDAQTLAMMLQEQLDAINNEIRFVN